MQQFKFLYNAVPTGLNPELEQEPFNPFGTAKKQYVVNNSMFVVVRIFNYFSLPHYKLEPVVTRQELLFSLTQEDIKCNCGKFKMHEGGYTFLVQ